MRGKLRVLATLVAAAAVIQPAVLAQGTSPWVDAVANLSAATVVSLEFWIIVPAGLFSLPAGINQTRATLAALQHKPVSVAAP